MKKLASMLLLLLSYAGYSNENKEIIALNSDSSTQEKFDPVQCCTRRASSGTYGQPDYNQVSVTRCSTSSISYQDAQARACVLAEASADKALEISQNTSLPVTVGG